MSLKSYLTRLLDLDKRDDCIRKVAAAEAKKEAIEAVEALFKYGLRLTTDDWPKIQRLHGLWGPDYGDVFRGWLERNLLTEIQDTYKEKIAGELDRQFKAHIASEALLDQVIDRINRKQVRAGISMDRAAVAERSDTDKGNAQATGQGEG